MAESDGKLTEYEIQKRRDDALKRALSMPPNPKKAKPKPKKKTPAK